jgi:hypothetical protein
LTDRSACGVRSIGSTMWVWMIGPGLLDQVRDDPREIDAVHRQRELVGLLLRLPAEIVEQPQIEDEPLPQLLRTVVVAGVELRPEVGEPVEVEHDLLIHRIALVPVDRDRHDWPLR